MAGYKGAGKCMPPCYSDITPIIVSHLAAKESLGGGRVDCIFDEDAGRSMKDNHAGLSPGAFAGAQLRCPTNRLPYVF